MPCPEKYFEALQEFGVAKETIDEIYEGYDEITSKTPKKVKAAFFKRAVDIMDEKVDPETESKLMAYGACCRSGAREKRSKEFKKVNAELTIEEKLKKIAETPDMYMGWGELTEDGLIYLHAVNYWNEDKYECACSNFNHLKRDYPVSKNYCMCCAGHFQYHYEIMLDRKLSLKEVVLSPLDSEGKNPCAFLFRMEQA